MTLGSGHKCRRRCRTHGPTFLTIRQGPFRHPTRGSPAQGRRRIVKLFWSSLALADRDGIFTHIEADNPRAAIAVDERIEAAAGRLVDLPEPHIRVLIPAFSYSSFTCAFTASLVSSTVGQCAHPTRARANWPMSSSWPDVAPLTP